MAAAAYPETWWLPRAADGIRHVLAPRERTGRAGPPIALPDLLADLRLLEIRWAGLSGYAELAPGLAHLRELHEELDAWYRRALYSRARALAPVLSAVFGIDLPAARAVAHGYAAISESTGPGDVPAHFAAYAGDYSPYSTVTGA